MKDLIEQFTETTSLWVNIPIGIVMATAILFAVAMVGNIIFTIIC